MRLLNDSVIPAEYRIFTKTKRSVFSPDIREGVLAPHESIQVTVTVRALCLMVEVDGPFFLNPYSPLVACL